MTGTPLVVADPVRIQEVLDGRWAKVRNESRELLRDNDFAPVFGESIIEARTRITRLAKKLGQTGRTAVGLPAQYGRRR